VVNVTYIRRMPSSGMICHVALVRTDVSEECITSIIRVTRTGELGTMLTVTSNQSMLRRNSSSDVSSLQILVTLMMEAIHSSKTSVLTRATWHNIPEDSILHSYCHESLKSYIHYLYIFSHPFISFFTAG
jgi:hypothetical protein